MNPDSPLEFAEFCDASAFETEPTMAKTTTEADDGYAQALERIGACREKGSEGDSLNLIGLDLTSLPPEIGELTALTTLELNYNQLTTLPPEIGKLTALTTLELNYNQLAALPPDVGSLTALTTLRLGNNNLTTLPVEIGKLTALTTLELNYNQLTRLPLEIGKLTALTTLELNYNQLTTLPPQLGKLTVLTTLWLSYNQLTTLPVEISQLTALTTLWLNNNRLTTLPPEFSKLTALTTLFLHGNPALGLPDYILRLMPFEVGGRRKNATRPGDILTFYFAQCGATANEINFCEAEELLQRLDPEHYLLGSELWFEYCGQLLERGEYQVVRRRAATTLEWAEQRHAPIDAALDRLLLGRADLMEAEEENTSDFERAEAHLNEAIKGFQQTKRSELLVHALLARAAKHRLAGDLGRAAIDLGEALITASRDELRTQQVDCHLELARLSLTEGNRDQTSQRLSVARDMVARMRSERLSQSLDRLEQIVALVQTLHDGDTRSRRVAVRSLAELRARETLPLLRRLTDPDPDLRQTVAAALQLMTMPDWRGIIQTRLFAHGQVAPGDLPAAPDEEKRAALNRYFNEHAHLGLIHPKQGGPGNGLAFPDPRMVSNWKALWGGCSARRMGHPADFRKAVTALVGRVADRLGVACRPAGGGSGVSAFLPYFLELGEILTDLACKGDVPVFVFQGDEWTEAAWEDLIEQLRTLVPGPGRLFFLIVFTPARNLREQRESIERHLRHVFAYDACVCGCEQLVPLIGAARPRQALRNMVLRTADPNSISPFTTAGPTPRGMFFGREREMREMIDHLDRSSYVLIGGRKIGKTSILRHLHGERLAEAGFRTLYFDCSIAPSRESFLRAAVRGSSVPPLPETLATFRDLFEAVPADRPLVLLLDEADKLVPEDRKNDWPLFNTLRALSNAGRTQLVLGGEHTLRTALVDSASPLFNFVKELLIRRLDFRAVEELVTEPMRRLELELRPDCRIVERIWEFTSGHPNVVQCLCHRLILRVHLRESRQIAASDVDAIIKDPDFVRRDFLGTYFSRATVLEHLCVLEMASRDDLCTLSAIYEYLEGIGLEVSRNQIDSALERLVDLRDILERTADGYSFAVTAMPMVLRGLTRLRDLIALRCEVYRYCGDIEPEAAPTHLQGQAW